MRANTYKLKYVPTKEQLIACGFRDGGIWMHKNAVLFKDQVFCIPSKNYKFSVAIFFTEDFSAWDDFNNVLILDEEFCQPYGAFCAKKYKQDLTGFPALEYCVSKYNKFLDSFDFLEVVS